MNAKEDHPICYAGMSHDTPFFAQEVLKRLEMDCAAYDVLGDMDVFLRLQGPPEEIVAQVKRIREVIPGAAVRNFFLHARSLVPVTNGLPDGGEKIRAFVLVHAGIPDMFAAVSAHTVSLELAGELFMHLPRTHPHASAVKETLEMVGYAVQSALSAPPEEATIIAAYSGIGYTLSADFFFEVAAAGVGPLFQFLTRLHRVEQFQHLTLPKLKTTTYIIAESHNEPIGAKAPT